MNLIQFIDWALKAGTVGKYTDGQFVGECVSLINQYLARVFGIMAGAWGHAKDWATSSEVRKYFDIVKTPQAGDIGISGATPSNPYGHIWIYTSPNTIIEQNGRVARRVSVGSAYANPIAILRRKGASVANTEQLAIDRMSMLVGIASIVIPNFKGEVDGNNYPQIVANIHQLYAQNNNVTRIAEDRLKRIKELEAGVTGEYVPYDGKQLYTKKG